MLTLRCVHIIYILVKFPHKLRHSPVHRPDATHSFHHGAGRPGHLLSNNGSRFFFLLLSGRRLPFLRFLLKHQKRDLNLQSEVRWKLPSLALEYEWMRQWPRTAAGMPLQTNWSRVKNYSSFCGVLAKRHADTGERRSGGPDPTASQL